MPTNEISLKTDASLTSSFPRNKKLTLVKVRSAYQRLAPVYDQLFGACFRQGQRKAVGSLGSQPGEKILEMGVGTGLALPLWNRATTITGIDVSEGMLSRAESLCQRHQLKNVELRLMDAQATTFPDNHFDKIAAMYVVSVVPNVKKLLAEMQRICKPGGQIAIVNHFAHPNPLINRMERILANHAPLLGFNTALAVENVLHAPGFNVLHTQPVNWGGYWTLIIVENNKKHPPTPPN